MEAYYFKSTHTAKVTLEDEDELPVAGATVDFTLQKNGVDVAGQPWPLALVDQGDGTYEALVSEALVVNKGDRLVAIIDSLKGTAKAHAEVTVKVVVDGS